MQYPVDQNITHLYHSTSRRLLPLIMRRGLEPDHVGFIYLSERPLPGFEVTIKVTIPDINQLMDWREAWYDDNGEEIDMDHEYDPSNPYYIYLSLIPPEYLEEVDPPNYLKEYILKSL